VLPLGAIGACLRKLDQDMLVPAPDWINARMFLAMFLLPRAVFIKKIACSA